MARETLAALRSGLGRLARETGARLTSSLDLPPGKSFQLGRESSLGYNSCDIGIKRPRSERPMHDSLKVDLLELPPDPDGPVLYVQVAERGWVNLANKGGRPFKVRLPNRDGESLIFTDDNGPVPREPINGEVELLPGEGISVRQGDLSFFARWQAGERKVVLQLKGVAHSDNQPGLDINYLKPPLANALF